jgi:hypothetical protein
MHLPPMAPMNLVEHIRALLPRHRARARRSPTAGPRRQPEALRGEEVGRRAGLRVGLGREVGDRNAALRREVGVQAGAAHLGEAGPLRQGC